MSIVELANLEAKLSLGQIQAFRRLAVVPLVDASCGPSGCLTLDDALAGGSTEVTEVSEAGSVPQLKLLNREDRSVFLLDGEELIGAKQNRILNVSILVPGRAELVIPVSCVEQGRWSWRAKAFRGTDRVIFSKARRRNAEAVSFSLKSRGSRVGDQHAVWKDIAEKSARMSVHSDTAAASALYEKHGADLDEFVKNLVPVPGQVGAAFLLNGQFAGLDLLAGPDLLERLLSKLVRSYALDALDDDEAEVWSPSAGTQAIEAALRTIGRLGAARHQAVGIGEELRFSGDGLVGSALLVGGDVVHLGVWSNAYR